MKLTKVKIEHFKSVSTSTCFDTEPDVTALIGKNESGKTIVLQSIYRLSPLPSGYPENFEGLRDYPRSEYNRDKKKIGDVTPISLTFELEASDLEVLEEEFGQGSIQSKEFTVKKKYENDTLFFSGLDIDEMCVIKHYLDEHDIDPSKYIAGSIDEIAKLLRDSEVEETVSIAKEIESFDIEGSVRKTLHSMLPKFQYFDEYSTLPGEVSINRLQNVNPSDLNPEERTALSLLKLAGVDTEEFAEQDYEPRKASLEAAANQITDELFRYWSQNKDLEIELDIDFKPSPQNSSIREPWLVIRVKNTRHRVTLSVNERSKGFIWFFSFLVAFSEYDENDNRVILLDEPGTSLHAKAQNDLLNYIDDRLAISHQVIYTTHSLFMINSNKLERCRTVEDIDPSGTTVSKEIWRAGSDTIFPLLGALGVDMTQTLIIGPHQLLVEGPSDVIYLQLMSAIVEQNGKRGIDPKWTITPVGGLDKLPTFIALLGSSNLDVTVITDVSSGGNQKLDNLINRGLLSRKHFIPLTDFTDTPEADIEDMFDQSWYIKLLKLSKTANIKKSDLHNGRIVKQVEAVYGKYDHFKPAEYLLRKDNSLVDEIDTDTIDRFSALFNAVNESLSAD